MFGRSAGGWIGSTSFLFDSDRPFLVAFFLFQLGFIGTATALISGAVAERMRFGGCVALTFFVSAVTYPLFGHNESSAALPMRLERLSPTFVACIRT
jgi:ammonium transporter, Amt family